MESQKKFSALFAGKKKAFIIGIAVFLLVSAVGRGVAFNLVRANRGHFFNRTENVALAIKDFEAVEIVFAEVSAGAFDGYRKTYNALMQEAALKGADAIINVNVSSSIGFLSRTWNGSALAIKYTDTIQEGTSVETATAALSLRGGRGMWNNRFWQ